MGSLAKQLQGQSQQTKMYAKGGKVKHDDSAQDKKLIQKDKARDEYRQHYKQEVFHDNLLISLYDLYVFFLSTNGSFYPTKGF